MRVNLPTFATADPGCGGLIHTAVPRSTQPGIPPGSLNRILASTGEKAGMYHLCREAGNTM